MSDATFPPSPFDDLYGLRLTHLAEDEVRAHVDVEPHHMQPAGLVHGGVFAAMAEAMASAATYVAVAPDGLVAQGLSNQTSFLRPVTAGTIHGTGRRRHRGRSTWVWEIDLADDAGRLCAIVRMTIAVRPAPGG